MSIIKQDYGELSGGELNGTDLWVNSSPSSTQGYGSITLNQSISNFKYLKFIAKGYNGWTDSNDVGIIISVEDFIKLKGDSSGGTFQLTAVSSGAGVFSRRMFYQDDTHIYVYQALRINADGTNNAMAILERVIGLR